MQQLRLLSFWQTTTCSCESSNTFLACSLAVCSLLAGAVFEGFSLGFCLLSLQSLVVNALPFQTGLAGFDIWILGVKHPQLVGSTEYVLWSYWLTQPLLPDTDFHWTYSTQSNWSAPQTDFWTASGTKPELLCSEAFWWTDYHWRDGAASPGFRYMRFYYH